MQNIVIIGVILVALIGGIMFLGNTEPEADMNDVAMEEMVMENEVMDEAMEEPMAEPEPDIIDTAVNTPTLSTLVAAVTAGGLVDTLQGDGPFTVFAPTNDAFDALPAGTVETLLDPANIADLQAILTYHVVPGAVMAGDLVDGMEVETVNGDTIIINVSDDGVSINGGPTVVMADVVTSNGVVHVIDGVLLPSAE